MPPSGYNNKQAEQIGNFLLFCSNELLIEAEKFKISVGDALIKEIGNIDLIVNDSAVSSAQKSILLLTKDFYSRVKSHSPQSRTDFKKVLEEVLSEIKNEVLLIKVPEIA